MFEGSFLIKLMDEMERTITSTSVREIAPGSWRVEKERSLKRRLPLRRLPVLFFWFLKKITRADCRKMLKLLKFQ